MEKEKRFSVNFSWAFILVMAGAILLLGEAITDAFKDKKEV